MNDESEHQELEQNQMLDIIIRKQDFIRIFSHLNGYRDIIFKMIQTIHDDLKES